MLACSLVLMPGLTLEWVVDGAKLVGRLTLETILARRFSYAYRDGSVNAGDSGPRAAMPSPGAVVGGRA